MPHTPSRTKNTVSQLLRKASRVGLDPVSSIGLEHYTDKLTGHGRHARNEPLSISQTGFLREAMLGNLRLCGKTFEENKTIPGSSWRETDLSRVAVSV
jgi:hypothetical protein